MEMEDVFFVVTHVVFFNPKRWLARWVSGAEQKKNISFPCKKKVAISFHHFHQGDAVQKKEEWKNRVNEGFQKTVPKKPTALSGKFQTPKNQSNQFWWVQAVR